MKQSRSKSAATAKLSDVARLARVSTATVSRALSLPEKVSPRTLRRVQDAVRKLGYVPHGAARALRSNRTYTIGTVIPTLDNAIFAKATHALQKTLEDAGYTLLVACHEYDPQGEIRVTRPLIERGVDGLVLVGVDHDPALFELMNGFGIPYVITWALDKSGRHACVGFDNRKAASQLASYLLDIGHRRLAMIAGLTAANDRARERVNGVREALAARGRELPPAHLVEKPYTIVDGRDAMHALMALRPRPTAVICGNDVLALGALMECRNLRLRVPRDVSVTGFDDLEVASVVTPALTTVRVPAKEMGEWAARHLLARLAEKEVAREQELPVDLVLRETTAPPSGPAGPKRLALRASLRKGPSKGKPW